MSKGFSTLVVIIILSALLLVGVATYSPPSEQFAGEVTGRMIGSICFQQPMCPPRCTENKASCSCICPPTPTTTNIPPAPSCLTGTATATIPVTYGNSKIYATSGSNNNWAVLRISSGGLSENIILKVGSSYNSKFGVSVKLISVAALQDGTVVGATMTVCSYSPPPTTTITTKPSTITPCISEGGSGAVVPNTPSCCPGLVSIGCDRPDASGYCPTHMCAGAFFCTKCGDGICGLGENKCNCPKDCELRCCPPCPTGAICAPCEPGLLPCPTTTTTTPCPVVIGTMNAINGFSYGNYIIYAITGATNSWANIVIKNVGGTTVASKIINQGSSYSFTSQNIGVTVFNVSALQDGTIIGVGIGVHSLVCQITTTCKNLCGDGVCQQIVCMGLDCPCPETSTSCPKDCAK
jgi:hypothetical protein